MQIQRITWFLLCFLCSIQAFAQIERVKPAASPSEERAEVQSERTSPQTTPTLEEEFTPVHHLWGDLDGDGLSDLFVLNKKGNLLFRNLGDGGFENVTGVAFPDGAGCGAAGFLGDYNGDELLDLFLFPEEGFTLYRNEGKLRFRDVTESLGFEPWLPVRKARLMDYDGDGNKDLLVETRKGDRIYRNRGGFEFGEVTLTCPKRRSNTIGKVPPIPSLGGPALPGAGSSGSPTWDAIYVNDNSPNSVGIGVPEVEGGSDLSTANDIVDGTITGEDIQNDSVQPEKVKGTAATLTGGDQSFNKGTLFIDAKNDRVGVRTTSPEASLHVLSELKSGLKVENDKNNAVYGVSPSDGVHGVATATSGINYGVYGESDSKDGYGVFGTSPNIGVEGESSAEDGYGVSGKATASQGNCYGVKGESLSNVGYGVYGTAPRYGVYGVASYTYDNTYGVYGISYSDYGNGVFGQNQSTYGIGVKGMSQYMGVQGHAYGLYGYGYGVYGKSSSENGTGVWGEATNASGDTRCVHGTCASSNGYGVLGENNTSSGVAYGVCGITESPDGRGVLGSAIKNFGVSYGVRGVTSSNSGYGVYSDGDLGCSGTKSFIQPHPHDPSKEIRFVCMEGNESGTYFRGSSRLEGGKAVIEVPEEFRLVTEAEGLTVQVTPKHPVRVGVAEKNLQRIIVVGEGDVEFDYFVNGVRRGFAGFEPIRENHAWVPEYRGKSYGTQFPEALRRILVKNGILNPDLTPNEKTAARMGWILRDEAEERFPEPDDKDLEPHEIPQERKIKSSALRDVRERP